MSTHPEYVRICPVCATEAAADATQCTNCGTLLLGVDLTLKQVAAAPAAAPPTARATTTQLKCPHTDCGLPNPPDIDTCLYCGRPLVAGTPAVPPAPTSLYRLPAALAEKFRIVEVLPAGGAEAEIMIVAGISSGIKVVAKIYRPGIQPKTEVLERVNRAGFAHVVRLISYGVSDGIGYEVMEYCVPGSLRRLMTECREEPLPRDVLRRIVEEIAGALDALHGINIIHRDLKPENVLVRRRDPLDLVLTDFGIASVNDATQRFTGLARTVKYGAPETLAGVLDQAADYWSLGLILVELLTGHHPFDGLSDAVITHQLVTGNVDLAEIDDPEWHKLCRGLLLRDPKRRWGITEIRRWLAGDATLIAPEETAATAGTNHAGRPYRMADIVCQSPVELGAALALHWEEGRKDLMRGQLSAWVGKELGDDNLLRTIQDLLELRDVSDDMRLLRLIRHLTPEMPPVWRGASLGIPNLVAQAAGALTGKPAAAEWLVSIYVQKVLRELPAAQFPAEAALAARWEIAYEQLVALWPSIDRQITEWRRTCYSRNGVTDFDALVFGQPEALALPPLLRLHPSLLLALADDGQAANLRQRVIGTAGSCLGDNPWLETLLADDNPMGWLAAELLMPQARSIAEDLHKHRAQVVSAETAQFNALVARANQILARLRATCEMPLNAGALEREACLSSAQGLLTLIEEARQEAVPDDTQLMRALHRAEPVVLRIQESLDAWEHAARINAAWRNRNFAQGAGGFLLFAFVFAAEMLPSRYWLWGLLILGLVIGWRLWSVMELRGNIRDLGRALPNRVPSVLAPMPQ